MLREIVLQSLNMSCRAIAILYLGYGVLGVCAICSVTQSCLVLCNTLNGSPTGSSVHVIFLGKSTGVACHFLLKVIFLNQGSNLYLLCLLHCRQILYHWTIGKPKVLGIFWINICSQDLCWNFERLSEDHIK